MFFKLKQPVNVFYDTATAEEAEAAAAKASEEAAAKAAESSNKKRTYTEDEYQKAIEAERKRADESARAAIKELEAHKKNKSLTEAEKTDLQKKIDDLNTQFLTKEELYKKDRDKLVNTYETNLKEVTSDRDTWKTRFVESTVARELTDAAIKEDAYDPSVFLALLGTKTEVVEEKDDDGRTLGFKVKVKLQEKSKDGKAVTLELDPVQAIKQLKDQPDKFGYLFKGHTATGVGGNGSRGTTKAADYENMTPEQWRELRSEALK